MRCTKLCRELLATGQCTDPGCMYAHSKHELRNASSSKSDAMKRKSKRGGSKEKEAVQQNPVEVKAQEVIVPPPGLESLDRFSEGLYAEVPVGAEELKLYTQALAAVLQTLPSNLMPSVELPKKIAKQHKGEKFSKGDFGLGSLSDPAYVPLRLCLDELPSWVESGEGAASVDSGEDLTEASTVAEEVAASALEGLAHDDYEDSYAEGLGVFGGSSYAGALNVEAWERQDCQNSLDVHSMENAWDWNMWGADGGAWMDAGHFSSFGSLATMTQAGTPFMDFQERVFFGGAPF